jgi:hypothetical protein
MQPYKQTPEDKTGIFKHIIDNAMGNPIILGSEPTQAKDLKANTWGYYSGKLYIRFASGELYSFTGTQIT